MKRARRITVRLLALMLCVAMFPSVYSALAEDNSFIDFEPTLTEAFDQSASSWYSSSTYRALLTITLLTDCDSAVDLDLSAALTNSSYVGKKGFFLVVGMVLDGATLIMTYSPITGDAAYLYSETTLSTELQELLIESTMENICTDGYSKNDLEDIYLVLKTLVSAGD